MTNPPQQPGNWQQPPWSPAEQQPTEQPYAGPYDGTPVSSGYAIPPGYAVSPGYAAPPGSPTGYPGFPGYGYGTPMPIAAPNNSLAIASLVLSLCGLFSGITAPVGAILGHVARRQIRERGEAGAGMALAGIIVGWIVTGLYVAVIAFVVAVAIFAVNHPDSFPAPQPT
jgi:hypothetical protein